ncbi:MAG: SO_0444 family Cu/Zn efflux transporter [Elusimicrobiota bacterium]
MPPVLLSTLSGFWSTLCEMAPYLLFGFAAAGALSVLISPGSVERHLGGKDRPFLAVLKATLFGIPLPLCSCGVIPVTASLKRHGASHGAATAFLIATPQTGVDSIMVTYALLGPVVTAFRPLAALVGGLLGGVLVARFSDDEKPAAAAEPCKDECCDPKTVQRGKLAGALRYGFLTLPKDIGNPMLVGLILAGLINALIPPHYFHELTLPLQQKLGGAGASLLSMLVMAGIGIPLYVCATASVPIAAALMAKGVSAGAALVFLMTGPATNAAALTTLWKIMGRKTTAIYVATIAVVSLGFGLALDLFFPEVHAVHVAHYHPSASPWGTWSGIALLAVLLFAVVPDWLAWAKPPKEAAALPGEIVLTIQGMTCSHCAAAVQRALLSCRGVVSAEVDLASGKAKVKGTDVDAAALAAAVKSLGYEASGS